MARGVEHLATPALPPPPRHPSSRRPGRRSAARSRRSWLISSSASPRAAFSAASSFRICAWMVTSSAVVGSSAISKAGSLASAIAIITRWRCPPESWCGNASSRCAASGKPTSLSSSITRARSRLRRHPPMQLHRLGDLLADPGQRIEAGHRLLEHHAGDAAAQPAQQTVAGADHALAVDHDAAGRRWRPAAATAAATAR